MFINLFKSILHNVGVLSVGFIFAFIGVAVDSLLGISRFESLFATIMGCLCLAIGFLIRVWATFYFYEQHMSVIRLKPQKKLFTSGPYGFSRNPLYLGGNVFIFLGAALFLGSPSGVVLTVIVIRSEEHTSELQSRQ